MNNKLNSYMDHVWDGFYQGQIRMSRFPGIVEATPDSVYDITMTGSPAKKMRFTLIAKDKAAAMLVRIAYPGAESRQIKIDDKYVPPNEWDDTIQNYGAIKREKCGENRYIGVKNVLEFYLTSGCTLFVSPRDAIQTLVRMEWSLEDFYSGGGTTSFVDRLAGSLGIHASTIKIVSVYEGSLVLNYEIGVDDGDTTALEAVKSKQTEMFATGQVNLGAPILDVVATTVTSAETPAGATATPQEAPVSIVKGGIVAATGYDPVSITSITPG